MSFRPLARGAKASAFTERGTAVTIQYAIIEVGKLIASHDTSLKLNRSYPRKMQPRDRARIASEDQVGRIARQLRPELLTASSRASDGAPIIGSDGIVESGNARSIALMRVYANHSDKAAEYQAHLIETAAAFGLDVQKIRKAKRPVLVRIRLTEVDRIEFARECNEQSVAAMSAAEQARIDAEKLDLGMLSLFQPDEVGNIASAGNRDFIRAFVDRAVAPSERGRFMDADGYISQDGVRRIQHALIAKAFGDVSAIERLAEATEDNVRRISSVLIRKSAQLASLKLDIATGARHPYDISDHVAKAMRKLSALREIGQSVPDYLKQIVLCGEDLSQLERRILEIFEQYKLSGRILEDIVQCFIDAVHALGHPQQRSMLDAPLLTIDQLFEAAIERGTSAERKALRLIKRKGSRATFDRSAAAKKAWITIRSRKGLAA